MRSKASFNFASCENPSLNEISAYIRVLAPEVIIVSSEIHKIVSQLKNILPNHFTQIMVLTSKPSETKSLKAKFKNSVQYFCKTSPIEELLTIIQKLTEDHTKLKAKPAGFLEVSNLILDYATQCITVNHKEISVTPFEFQLLEVLIRNKNHFVPHNVLISELWPTSRHSAFISTHLSNVRRKIYRAACEIIYKKSEGVGIFEEF